MINIVIPMAGLGSRFANAGYALPKPLIDVHGVPMIKVVVDNLKPMQDHRFIFICQNEHIRRYGIDSLLESLDSNVELIGIDGVTEGQLCTVLKAKSFFDSNTPVLTANSDQYIDFDINSFLKSATHYDGYIMTMKSNDPKWSYAKVDMNGIVTETAEKKVISDEATVGIFYFSSGAELVSCGEAMIADGVRVNNEFYTCPVYNYMIKKGAKVGIYNIGREYDGMYGLGIPSDLEFFLNHPISQKIRK